MTSPFVYVFVCLFVCLFVFVYYGVAIRRMHFFNILMKLT